MNEFHCPSLPPSPASTSRSIPPSSSPTKPFPFLNLPLELREKIYALYFKPADRLRISKELEVQGYYGGLYGFEFGLLSVSRMVYHEAKRVWRRENHFVKILTPWPNTVSHISSEGLVPIVCSSPHANTFHTHTALIEITAAFHTIAPENAVIVLMDDVHLFAQTWYYSALAYPMLNSQLSVNFVLRDPYWCASGADSSRSLRETIRDQEEPRMPPLVIQKKLLLPFILIKGLHQVNITNYAPSLQADLNAGMAVSPPTLQQSLELAASHLALGDSYLAQHKHQHQHHSTPSHPTLALQEYTSAFHALHILITSRSRRVLADPFFHALVPAGRFAGRTGMSVRVLLRLQLVSRFVLAYSFLGEWAEAAFWGMRSVRIVRVGMDDSFDIFLESVGGKMDVGMLFVRTGVAIWMLGRAVQDGGREEWREEFEEYEKEGGAGVRELWVVGKGFLGAEVEGIRNEAREFGMDEGLMEEVFGTKRGVVGHDEVG